MNSSTISDNKPVTHRFDELYTNQWQSASDTPIRLKPSQLTGYLNLIPTTMQVSCPAIVVDSIYIHFVIDFNKARTPIHDQVLILSKLSLNSMYLLLKISAKKKNQNLNYCDPVILLLQNFETKNVYKHF